MNNGGATGLIISVKGYYINSENNTFDLDIIRIKE